jgi:hypothetical protein
MLKKKIVVIPKRAVSDLTWISKETDTEKLKARLLVKDIGKKERRLLKRAIKRLFVPTPKAKKSRVKKEKLPVITGIDNKEGILPERISEIIGDTKIV